MMERGHRELGPWAMIDSSERTSKISSEQANILTYKLVRVEDDGSFVPASEDEVTEVEHLLAEPKNENGLMDCVLGGKAARTDRNLEIEGFQCPGNYGQINSDCGAFYSSIAREGKVESKYEFLDGTLHGVYGGDLHIADGISIACDDYLLDSEYSEKVPDNDYGLCGETHFENLGRDSNSPRLGEGDRGAVVISNSFTPTISQLESSSDRNSVLLEKMTVCELQETFRSTFGRETSNKDKQWLKRRIMFGLQNLVEVDSGSLFLESGRSSNESEGNLIFTCSDDSAGRTDHSFTNHLGNTPKLADHGLGRVRFSGRDAMETSYRGTGNVRHRPLITVEDRESVHQSQKRLRKPTKRYIEESSNPKSRPCGARLEFLITNSGDKITRPRSHNHNHRKGFGATPVVHRKDSFKGFGIQVPFGLQVTRGCPKKNTSILEHHSEDNDEYLGPSPAESQDDTSDESFTRSTSEKGGSRRKHHRLWSLSEVVKLIDGVSQYGVGRWTEIKRLLFSTSAHRTSVDLKDKWRNLLRASGAQLPNKKYVEHGRKHPATRPIPASLLRRVSELAVIYPYPRERTSKVKDTETCTRLVPVTPANFSDSSMSRSGRIIQRKNPS